MPFVGTIVNFFAVLLFGLLGLCIKKGIPERISNAVIYAMGIAVTYIGIEGALEAPPPVSEDSFLSAGLVKILIMILSMGLGTLIGELLDVDKLMNRFGAFVERKLCKGGESGSFAKGFVSCSILFCVGAMAVNGSIRDAFGEPDILIAKAAVDAIMVLVMSTTLGLGCLFSAFSVLVYQGALTALALLVATVIPEATVTYMSVTGSLVITLIGTNMLGMTKVKTANMVFTIFMPIILAPLFSLF